MRARLWLLCFLCLIPPPTLWALDPSVTVFEEPGFPVADTAGIASPQLHALFPGASFVGVQDLGNALAGGHTKLLVLAYGSAFPEESWPGIYAYLESGGNLLVLGGRPFTRAAYRAEGAWRLREYSVRFIRQLMVDQFQQTPGSAGLTYLANPDTVTQLPPFSWERSFSPILHLSASHVSDRIGAAGRIDSRIDALSWGTRQGHFVSAPVVQIDHLRERFVGGRWIWVDADLPTGFGDSAGAREIVPSIVAAALRGAEEFQVTPVLPLYLPGESIALNVQWTGSATPFDRLTLHLTITPEDTPRQQIVRDLSLEEARSVTISAPQTKGFHRIDAELREGDRPIASYHSGFWMRDEGYLRSGPKLGVGRDYFELDGKPLAVVGTTYMSSEVQRLFFDHPNVFVWDRDLGQIQDAGMNMIRTGWWSGWDKICDENGVPYERTLRTLEAYLMTARRHGLPVQFNVFAFLPDVLGGKNAYLDPVAIEREKSLYIGLARRFGDVPYLAWDLINEPSFGQHLWSAQPNGDSLEAADWNAWLRARYSSPAALEIAWGLPAGGGNGTIAEPSATEYGGAEGGGPKIHDFYLFEQEKFTGWVATIREAIRSTGSHQLITVGQDEGGNTGRLLPSYFSSAVDFTVNHSWFQSDGLLWNSLVAKQPGKPMLIQEMGVGAGTNPDNIERRSLDDQAALFERKIALSFAQGSGAIEWLWNSNADMLEDGEVALGAFRADKTEKPEADVMRRFATFAKAASDSLLEPQSPDVAIVTSEAAQFSSHWDLEMEAQRNAVRALCYGARVTGSLVGESQVAKLGHPKLVILPSAQALSESTWQALLSYVEDGGTLLVTGPIQRDEHWHLVDRLASAQIGSVVEPLTFRTATMRAGGQSIPLSFSQARQSMLDAVQFKDGSTLAEKPLGRGKILWAAFPVELADNAEAAALLYSLVVQEVGLSPVFEATASLPPGVLVYPIVLRDELLYIFASEDAADAKIDLRDKLTGASLQFNLPSRHAALVLLRKKDGSVVAKYGY